MPSAARNEGRHDAHDTFSPFCSRRLRRPHRVLPLREPALTSQDHRRRAQRNGNLPGAVTCTLHGLPPNAGKQLGPPSPHPPTRLARTAVRFKCTSWDATPAKAAVWSQGSALRRHTAAGASPGAEQVPPVVVTRWEAKTRSDTTTAEKSGGNDAATKPKLDPTTRT